MHATFMTSNLEIVGEIWMINLDGAYILDI
jgi:hypothetical protein